MQVERAELSTEDPGPRHVKRDSPESYVETAGALSATREGAAGRFSAPSQGAAGPALEKALLRVALETQRPTPPGRGRETATFLFPPIRESPRMRVDVSLGRDSAPAAGDSTCGGKRGRVSRSCSTVTRPSAAAGEVVGQAALPGEHYQSLRHPRPQIAALRIASSWREEKVVGRRGFGRLPRAPSGRGDSRACSPARSSGRSPSRPHPWKPRGAGTRKVLRSILFPGIGTEGQRRIEASDV